MSEKGKGLSTEGVAFARASEQYSVGFSGFAYISVIARALTPKEPK